ncbi:MAG: transglycosylase SLT domain-containing protein [Azospirillaceae bacterium]|nr:transglycosylase SLT domain-containing protein [Azospirillaceae bacterium]
MPARADSCTDAVLNAEQTLDIPSGLLLSIALVESGGGGAPNALALNVGGRAIISNDPAIAQAHLRDSSGRIRSNVNAGCMQLSVYYHRSGFRPVEKILDPAANVWYAARFMARLRHDSANWAEAVARYHGGSVTGSQGYVCKVWRNLNQLSPESADTLKAGRCSPVESVRIAPATRRAFDNAQVAQSEDGAGSSED